MKISLNTVNQTNSISTINSNFAKLATELQDKVLYRDNPTGEPNELENDLDANGKGIYNAGAIQTQILTVDGQNVSVVEINSAVAATAADRVQTGLDRVASAESAASALNSKNEAAAAAASAILVTDGWENVAGNFGYQVPVPYGAGIEITSATQTVEYNGVVYAAMLSEIPFTTSGVFEASKFKIVWLNELETLALPTGSSLVGYTAADTEVKTVETAIRDIEVVTDSLPAVELLDVISRVTAFMSQELSDYRGDTLPNSFRRVVEYRRPPIGGDVYMSVAEKSINTTSVGYCLRYFAGCAEEFPTLAVSYAPVIRKLASVLLAMQHVDDRLARYGGFALAPKEGTASCFNAAMCGLGLVAAYRVTNDPVYLESAKRVASFLSVLNNPNPKFVALYGVTPIPAVAQNAGWNGFCDQISPGDSILTTHTTWNLLACEFLKELYEATGDAAYDTLYQATRDWGATGVTGFYDFWSVYHAGALPSNVSNNWSATGLTVSDGTWHRRGESVSGSTQNTGACTAASATTITLGAGASAIDNAYNGMAIRMTSGASINKGSVITAYNGTTKVATLRYPFPVTPTAGDTYLVGLSVNTIGSDQVEYGIEALYATGYNLANLRTAYETIRSWINADVGAFGLAYDSRICWTGYFRPFAQVYGGASRAFGTQYDVQGIGPLLLFKKEQYPEDWAVSLEKALLIPEIATLVDKDFNTIWSTDFSGLFQFTTVGVGTVKGTVGLGIVRSFNA